jgi:hypothetical protein
MFDSRFILATGTWLPGIATAEAIRAGDSGGKREMVARIDRTVDRPEEN